MKPLYSTILLWCIATHVFAQPFLKGRQEVTLGWGYYTHEQVVNILGGEFGSRMTNSENSVINNTVSDGVFGVRPMALDNRRRSGAIFANYYFTPTARFSLGIGAGYESEQASVVAYLPSAPQAKFRHGNYRRSIFTIAPEARLYYTNKAFFKLYFMIGLGKSFVIETARSSYHNREQALASSYWRFQVSPLGIMIGNTIRGFAEVGYGYKGVARAGASWRF